MKVLYTFGGMPHYLNAMLNKLHNKGVEITVITPQKGNATIGKGVKMVEGGTYRHLTAIEKKAFYGNRAIPLSEYPVSLHVLFPVGRDRRFFRRMLSSQWR